MYDSIGTYRAKVLSTADPTNTGKIKVQCPQVAGLAELNWAEPANFVDPVPNAGDLVWIFFSGGDTTKPVYSITVDPYKWITPTLNAGWALGPAGGSTQPLRLKIDNGTAVRIYGAVHTTTTSPTATVFTLLSGYRPAIEARTGITYNNAGSISHMLAQVLTNGDVLTSPTPTSANADVYFNVWFPLGNLG